MNVREEDRDKNNCPSRGFGLAAAAIGVGVGAALYYFFNKRPENPDVVGSTTQWTCEEDPQGFNPLHDREVTDSYNSTSEDSNMDTNTCLVETEAIHTSEEEPINREDINNANSYERDLSYIFSELHDLTNSTYEVINVETQSSDFDFNIEDNFVNTSSISNANNIEAYPNAFEYDVTESALGVSDDGMVPSSPLIRIVENNNMGDAYTTNGETSFSEDILSMILLPEQDHSNVTYDSARDLSYPTYERSEATSFSENSRDTMILGEEYSNSFSDSAGVLANSTAEDVQLIEQIRNRAFAPLRHSEDVESFITISENSTTDTSMFTSDTEAMDASNEESSFSEDTGSTFTIEDYGDSSNTYTDSDDLTNSTLEGSNVDSERSNVSFSIEDVSGTDSETYDFDVTESSIGSNDRRVLSQHWLRSFEDLYWHFRSPFKILTSEEEQMNMLREQAFRERPWSLEECSICFDVILKDHKVTTLPCTHHFHYECINPWLQEQQTCPNCRRNVE